MTESEIINKVKDYLIATNRYFNQELQYNGIRKNAPLSNGTFKDLHMVVYDSYSTNNDSLSHFPTMVTLDVETGKLEFILSKHILVKIEE